VDRLAREALEEHKAGLTVPLEDLAAWLAKPLSPPSI
jgi:hypothetical protein